MTYFKQHFMYTPGGEPHEAGSSTPDPKQDNTSAQDQSAEPKKEEGSIINKIKKALQDWSTEDKLEQEFDDTQV